MTVDMEIVQRTYARVGLLGNPSDGYFGKTISFSLANFYAEVTLKPSDVLRIIPHPVHDPVEFSSLESLATRARSEGYYGGVRLLLATCCCFHSFCRERGIQLKGAGNFSLSYETNIPRQTGLSGSSAIVCSALRCLLRHFGLREGGDIPQPLLPNLVLRAEAELGITAGLQDRVIQVFGGLVYMDFNQEHMEAKGHGLYEPLDPLLLPKLHIIFAENPGESGKVHSNVRKRWLDGDGVVIKGMREVADLAEKGRRALEQGDLRLLGKLMDENFALRRSMFGDAALGELNVKMVEVARSVGAHAKFTGSGGACVALCLDGEEQVEKLISTAQDNGFTVVEASVSSTS